MTTAGDPPAGDEPPPPPGSAPPPPAAPSYGQPPSSGQPPYYGPPQGAVPPPYCAAPYGAPPYSAPPYGYGQPAPPYGGYAPPGPYGYGQQGGYPPSPYAAYGVPPNRILDPVLGLVLAPWWKRFLALIMDGVLTSIVLGIFEQIIFAAVGRNELTLPPQNLDGTQTFPTHVIVTLLLIGLVGLVLSMLYYAILDGTRGQTIGKMALGIAVRDDRTGLVIGLGRGFGRYLFNFLLSILLILPYFIGNLAPLWDRRNQSWADHVVHSVVVEVRL